MTRVLPKGARLIPKEAKCVFEGVIYDVYQWQQQLFDGSFSTFEMLRRPDTVIIIAIKDDKLVLINEEQPGLEPTFNFPAGRVEASEDWQEGAKRELLEETGLSFKNWRLVDVEQPHTKIEWFITCYIAWDLESEVEPKPDAGEKIEVSLLSLDELQSRLKNLEPSNHKLDWVPAFVESAHSIADIKAQPEFTGDN